MKLSLLLLFGSLTIHNCVPSVKKPSPSKLKEFVQPEVVEEPEEIIKPEAKVEPLPPSVPVVLPRIPESIIYTQKRILLKVPGTNSPKADYEITFNNISESQCSALKDAFTLTYGTDTYRSKILCRAGDYKLKDFLPPLVGAIKGLAYRDESLIENFTLTENLGSNCENLAWEFARLSTKEFHAFFPQGSLFHNQFLELSHLNAELVLTSDFPDWKSILTDFVESAEYGDMISVYFKQKLFDGDIREFFQHIFVKIDGNLFFEKGNPGESYPYTYLTTQEIIKRWDAPSSLGTIFRWFRPTGKFPPAKSLPLITDLMTPSPDQTTTMKYEEYPFTESPSGKFSLPSKAFRIHEGSRL